MTANSSEIPTNLFGLQQWLQNAVTTPWQANGPGPEQVVQEGNGVLKPADRVNIYTRAYQGRLIECMESEFPALRFALGRDLFVRFASDYLIACHSESYTLTALGKRFPEYLRETRPDDDEELWPEFIIDLATLERFFSEVYHGEGTEDSEEAATTETEAILAEPGARWLQCRFPVDEYFKASRAHTNNDADFDPLAFPVLESEPIVLLLYRRNYSVQIRRISPEELHIVKQTQISRDRFEAPNDL